MTTARPSSRIFDFRTILRSNDAMMAIAVVVVVAMMLVDMPPFLLDIIVVINLAISVGIILMSMYVSSPMEFTVFPSLLLIVTLFRLGLNVSATRLILGAGFAGGVIETFGTIVVGGNYVVGIVIFLIILIIQFAVITSGAGRVAEVGARFTLDAMPGKQMAIDADLNAGLINEDEARSRRRDVQIEADFYGSMDGASKFVRGDSIASIVVMLVNIIGGFAIGMLQRGLNFQDALQTYALLTVGAGIAVQIPSLLISAASGLIVTRSVSDDSLGTDLIGQLGNINTLVGASIIILVVGLIPGLPKIPFFAVSAILGGAAYFVWRIERREEVAAVSAITDAIPPAPTVETPEEMMRMAVVDPIELEVGYGLITLVDEERADNLLNQINNIRKQMLTELGFVVPVVRIRDNLRLSPQGYRIKIRGEEISSGELILDRFLGIPGGEMDDSITGIPTTEPAFGMPALWISEAEKGRAELVGYTVVSPLAVMSTHLTEIIRGHAASLVSRQMVQEMLDTLRAKTPAAVDGIVPEMLSLGGLQDILRNMLEERVPIRDLAGILEVLAKHAQVTKDPGILAEAVRQNLSLTISNTYRDQNGYIHVFTLSPQLETVLRGSLASGEGGFGFQIDPKTAQSIIRAIGERMEQMAGLGHIPVLLCPRELRMAMRYLVRPTFPNLVILAFSEIVPGTKVQAHGMVESG
ncbi:MAG: flagellar biosynthesis protein FlhA [Anaerolineaceae bacterium]|nr:flagellar biosynthesis protein FlhA [Anaerolineaceae bacterium]